MIPRVLKRWRTRSALRMDGQQLKEAAHAFEPVLAAARARCGPVDWYPYSSLSNFDVVADLLSPHGLRLLDLSGGDPIADIGAADGDVAFFLESLGMKVDIVDHAGTNYNQLRGVRALAAQLHSSVRIHDLDLDAQFRLPRERYGLALFLGLLYHLKNPYYALETCARSVSFLLLSTRVAREANGIEINRLPVAYLLAPHEANNDATNYWIFTAVGLQRLLDRCGWEVLAWHHVGDTKASTPADADRDERVYCMLRSRTV
jgi:tRNA (mo5U34)-methyltransferase